MSPCSCGREATRQRITFDAKGNPVHSICPGCSPQSFDDPFRAPSDNKVYTGPEAMPKRYKRGADDVYRATDELIADTAELWDKGPTERAREHKRRTRRTAPLTQSELEAMRRWGDEVLAPIVRARREGR